jgi:hypothetical protein
MQGDVFIDAQLGRHIQQDFLAVALRYRTGQNDFRPLPVNTRHKLNPNFDCRAGHRHDNYLSTPALSIDEQYPVPNLLSARRGGMAGLRFV